jgi:hypothetical protein
MNKAPWSFEPDRPGSDGLNRSFVTAPVEGAGEGAWKAIREANSLRLSPQALRATFRSPAPTDAALSISPYNWDGRGSVDSPIGVSRCSPSPTNLIGEALVVTLPKPSSGARIGLGSNGRRLRKSSDTLRTDVYRDSFIPVVRDVGTPTRESPFASAMKGRSGWVQSWCHEHDRSCTPPPLASSSGTARTASGTRPITSPVLLPGFASSLQHRHQTSTRIELLQKRQPKTMQSGPLSTLGKTLREPRIRTRTALELHKALHTSSSAPPAMDSSVCMSSSQVSAFATRRPLVPKEWNPRRTNIRLEPSPVAAPREGSRPNWMHESPPTKSANPPLLRGARIVKVRAALDDYSRRIQERVHREGSEMLARSQARMESIRRQRERYQMVVRKSTRALTD